MKPVSIRFKCFGPYMEEQFIDFTRLEESRLFLICGETGSGKTTILDAMCYALYNKSSGGLRGDLAVMRCKLAGKDDETLVEFVFDSDGRRYKFVRTMRMARKNVIDTHNCLELADGAYVPIFENPKKERVNAKAQEIIGLTYEQFRQVIILPQGRFEKLLVSDSKEKETILVSLFHADRWQRIVDEISRRVTARDEELKQEKIHIETRLGEHGCASLAELEEKIKEETLAAEEIKHRAAEVGRAVTELRELYDRALVENQQFETLSRREAEYASLLAQEDDFLREEALLAQAETAESMKPGFASRESARAQLDRVQEACRKASEALSALETELAAALKKREELDAAAPEQEARKARRTRLSDVRELYRSLEGMREERTAAEEALRGARERHSEAESAFLRQDALWQEAQEAQRKAMAAYLTAQDRYRRSIRGILAEELEEGKACPVCGSLSHPEPASRSTEHVTDGEVEALNRAQKAAGETVSEAYTLRAAAEQEKNDALSALNDAVRKADVAAAEHEAAMQRKVEGIDTEKELEREILRLEGEIRAFELAASAAAGALSGVEKRLEVSRAEKERLAEELTAAREAYETQEAAWKDILSASGFEDEAAFTAVSMEPSERQSRREGVVKYRTVLASAELAAVEMRRMLAGREAPDPEGRKEALWQAETVLAELNKNTALAMNRLDRLSRDHGELTEKKVVYDASKRIVEEDMEFAVRLRGRSGVGLQRYVLGVMLTSITAAANRLLRNVYGGRYQLHRTDEIAGSVRKGGLELEVFDAANNERRSVTTLSGGEKFLMALGLAIGLSTVVQAQGSGIRLEAMFIDEGFGSLDRESVNDALEVLQSVTAGSGIVGIISHVEQLAETIPAKIEITKGKYGSTCRMRI